MTESREYPKLFSVSFAHIQSFKPTFYLKSLTKLDLERLELRAPDIKRLYPWHQPNFNLALLKEFDVVIEVSFFVLNPVELYCVEYMMRSLKISDLVLL